MASHSLEVRLNDSFYRVSVSTVDCSDVYDYRRAIKKALSPELDSYSYDHFTLYQPDGTTEIPVETLVGDLKEDACGPMIVLVKNSITGPGAGSKKQLLYKGLAVESTCRKYLDAVAECFAKTFIFDHKYRQPTIGDVIHAKNSNKWTRRSECDGPPIALPDMLTAGEWRHLIESNQSTNERIHNGQIPKEDNGKSFIVVTHDEFEIDYVSNSKQIAFKLGLFKSESDLVVKDNTVLSGSESGSPARRENMQ